MWCAKVEPRRADMATTASSEHPRRAAEASDIAIVKHSAAGFEGSNLAALAG